MVYCDHQELFVVYCDHQVVIFPLLWLCAYPSGVEVIELWICGYSSCVEVIVVEFGFVPLPLCVEVIEFWLSALSLLCRGDCSLPLCPSLLCRGGWEMSCVLQVLCCNSCVGGPLCGRSYVDIVKIMLCEGGDVEQWLEPQNISRYLRLIHYL